MTRLTLPLDKVAARRVVRTARRARRAASSDGQWAELAGNLATGLLAWLTDRPLPGVVALYESLRTEPPTSGVRDALNSLGVQLLVPILLDDNDLSWRDLATGTDLGVDAIASVDLVITPGLAVARTSGLRLGQGGGSYDRALARARRQTPVLTMLFDDELVEGVPAEPHDRPVHAVLTPAGGVTAVGRAV